MGIYDKCLLAIRDKYDSESLSSTQAYSKDITQKEFISYSEYRLNPLTILYISDIHLEHQICREFPNGTTDEQIEDYIGKITSNLLSDEVFLRNQEYIVLFRGDIASEFILAKMFFSKFMEMWDEKSRIHYQANREQIYPLWQEKQRIKEELYTWKDKHEWVQSATKNLLDYSDKRVPIKIKKLIKRYREIKQLIIDTVGYSENYYLQDWNPPKKRVYAVLGNHELWSFASFEKCTDAYQELFDELGIIFLNNSGCYIRRKNEQTISFGDIAIIGGNGFAGYNERYNANCGLYRDTINREEEIRLTEQWEAFYLSSVKAAQEKKVFLLVLTHDQPFSWKKTKQLDSNCAYFYGHDHRNISFFVEEKNTYVFADNQIGYKAAAIVFKKTTIEAYTNPFASYNDGLHVVSTEDYNLFNRFKGIYISGTKRIESHIKYGAKLFMIKEKGYYGFFLAFKKQENGVQANTFICIGGSIKSLGNSAGIDYYREMFSDMVTTYIDLLSPYRAAQEKISEAVKSFGGAGIIHGYIVDIDSYNHIMLNPDDGKVTFYYSPVFGTLKTYDSLRGLLEEQNPYLLQRYLEQEQLTNRNRENMALTQSTVSSDFISIDIKNSQYVGSWKMNQLQRLFGAKVLRAWDDTLIKDTRKAILPLELRPYED